jgi:hypothetical protein
MLRACGSEDGKDGCAVLQYSVTVDWACGGLELSLAENLQAKRKVVRACSCRFSGPDPVAAVAPDLPRGTAGGVKKPTAPVAQLKSWW